CAGRRRPRRLRWLARGLVAVAARALHRLELAAHLAELLGDALEVAARGDLEHAEERVDAALERLLRAAAQLRHAAPERDAPDLAAQALDLAARALLEVPRAPLEVPPAAGELALEAPAALLDLALHALELVGDRLEGGAHPFDALPDEARLLCHRRPSLRPACGETRPRRLGGAGPRGPATRRG